jgi:RimJ/RimL family protein N-acetyltransferase
MLSGDRVLLRPIERSDLPRLWELLEDVEVAALAELGPIVRPHSSSTRPSSTNGFERPTRDWVAFAIEVDGEVIGECDLHHIHQFTRSCELGIAIGRPGSSRRDACGSIRGSGGTFEDELVMSALREDWKQQT